MTIAALAAAQAQPIHHVRAPRSQPQPDTTEASDQQLQARAQEVQRSVNLLV